ncbi:MAG: hypothetical protein M0035_12025 [Actinomycetota bacterium]|nr:hypothetical protein [Actinomycetota bacterium]
MRSYTDTTTFHDECASEGVHAERQRPSTKLVSGGVPHRHLGLRVASLGLSATLVGAAVLIAEALPAGAATRLTPTTSGMPVTGSQPDGIGRISGGGGAANGGFNPNGGNRGSGQGQGQGNVIDPPPQDPNDAVLNPVDVFTPSSNQGGNANQTAWGTYAAGAAAAGMTLWEWFQTVALPALPELAPLLWDGGFGGPGSDSGVIPGYGGSGGNCEATASSGGVRTLQIYTCNG